MATAPCEPWSDAPIDQDRQAELVNGILAVVPDTVCIALRDPYDAPLLAPNVRGLTAYGFRKCQLDAVVARLTHA